MEQSQETRSRADETSERQKSFARRALLKAGWVAPAVLAFNMPTTAGAASPHNDLPPHVDIPLHDDISFGGPHQDFIPHGDFVGAP